MLFCSTGKEINPKKGKGKGQLTKNKLIVLIVMCAVATVGVFREVLPFVHPTYNDVSTKMTTKIIVDAGHGGVDGGGVGIHGEIEKEINLKIAINLKEFLEFSGFEVLMIRDTDLSLHNADADTIARKKVSDLKNRLAIFNANPDALVVSVHQNKFHTSDVSGAQVFYGVVNQESRVLASSIQQAIVHNLQPNNTRPVAAGPKSIYLLMKAQPPMALVECGFLSNAEDAIKLKTDAYQKSVAFAIMCGIIQYCSSSS